MTHRDALTTVTADEADDHTRSRRGGAVQFNWAGLRALGGPRDARTSNREPRTNLSSAGRGEGVLAVAQTGFGEIVKFKLVDDQLGAILGVGVLDYPTELAVASIYRAQQRWPGIAVVTRGGRRKG